MTKHRVLIIADDLTGAADAAIAACAAGYGGAVVAFAASESFPDADVVAFDSNTRYASPDEAAAIVAQIVRHYFQAFALNLPAAGEQQIIYKKVDSTLRGNLAIEVAAILQAARDVDDCLHFPKVKRLAIVTPAFPATGRTTIGGHQYLHDQPVEHSEIWRRDGLSGSADIPSLLRGAGLAVERLTLVQIRAGETFLAEEMAARAGQIDALVCDALIEDDLRMIANAVAQSGEAVLWVGSAGLARYLPGGESLIDLAQSRASHDVGSAVRTSSSRDTPKMVRTADPTRIAQSHLVTNLITAPARHDWPTCREGPILIVIGSCTEVARRQVGKLAQEPTVRVLQIPASELGGISAERLAEIRAELADLLTDSSETILTIAGDAVTIADSKLCAALGEIVAPLTERIGALIVAGGETARIVLSSCGIYRLRLAGEIEPGVVLARSDDPRRLPVITKSGAFGNDQTLVRCVELLRMGMQMPVECDSRPSS